MRPSVATRDDLAAVLAREGFALLTGGRDAFDALPARLGAEVIHQTDVAVRPGRALVTSDRALDLHTDHHRADWVAWLCVRPSSAGGESYLADAEAAFVSLPEATRADLARLALFEHSIFPGDASLHPFVEERAGRRRFYCSFWFDPAGIPDAACVSALDAFAVAARAHEVARLRLDEGDVLIVDNRRVLHARTAITGTRDRHLVRHWLATRAACTSRPSEET